MRRAIKIALWSIGAIVALPIAYLALSLLFFRFVYPHIIDFPEVDFQIPLDVADPVPDDDIQFCPANHEGFARSELGMGNTPEVLEDDFLDAMNERGITVAEHYWTAGVPEDIDNNDSGIYIARLIRNPEPGCSGVQIEDGDTAYFLETSYRNKIHYQFIVVFDGSGQLYYAEGTHNADMSYFQGSEE